LEWIRLSAQKRNEIISDLIMVLEHVPEDKLHALETAISKNEKISVLNLRKITGLSGQQLDMLTMLVQDVGDKNSLLSSIQTGIAIWHYLNKDKETIDLTYTGPAQFSVVGRSTESVIEEMVENAKKRITIIGYRITENAREVIESLSKCIERGISITLVIDSDKENTNRDVLDNIWKGLKRPTVYTRIPQKKDVYFKIHAKMIIVDSCDLLVTSANLTWHGMTNNLEMGVRIRGPAARQAEKLVQELITSGYLRKM